MEKVKTDRFLTRKELNALNRLSLILFAGCIAAAPVMAAKTSAGKNTKKTLEDAAWGQTSTSAAKSAKKPVKKPGAKVTPTVRLHQKDAPPAKTEAKPLSSLRSRPPDAEAMGPRASAFVNTRCRHRRHA